MSGSTRRIGRSIGLKKPSSPLTMLRTKLLCMLMTLKAINQDITAHITSAQISHCSTMVTRPTMTTRVFMGGGSLR